MVFFSPTKNRSHLLSHHIPEVLIHIPCSFRADADASHAADALFRIRCLRIQSINGRDLPGASSRAEMCVVMSHYQNVLQISRPSSIALVILSSISSSEL